MQEQCFDFSHSTHFGSLRGKWNELLITRTVSRLTYKIAINHVHSYLLINCTFFFICSNFALKWYFLLFQHSGVGLRGLPYDKGRRALCMSCVLAQQVIFETQRTPMVTQGFKAEHAIQKTLVFIHYCSRRFVSACRPQHFPIFPKYGAEGHASKKMKGVKSKLR